MDLFTTEKPKRAKARVVEIKRGASGVWGVIVICPFCGQRHHHGAGNADRPKLGNRLSHCMDRPAQMYKLDRAGLRAAIRG
jgi:hypothetical protein